MITIEELNKFFVEIDKDFPVHLSDKTDLTVLSEKLLKNGLVCHAKKDGKVVAVAVGYANNTDERLAYISVVGTLKDYRGMGLAKGLVKEFIKKAACLGMEKIKLYTRETNVGAIKMYRSIGFFEVESDRDNDRCFLFTV